jgi:chromosomal replication initiation ATPase DnaA
MGQRNEAKQVAMYLIKGLCDQSSKEKAEVFSLGSCGSIGGIYLVIERGAKLDKALRRRIE